LERKLTSLQEHKPYIMCYKQATRNAVENFVVYITK